MDRIGDIIGSGKFSNVYEYKDGYALKLFHRNVDQTIALYEFEASNEIHALGIPTPAVYDFIQVGAQKGIVFQRVTGITLIEYISRFPLKFKTCIEQSAHLLAKIHSIKATGLESFKVQLADRISKTRLLSTQDKNTIIEYLFSLEDGNDLCHGDFHIGNIMCTERGFHIIDWGNVTYGPKVADLTLAITQLEIASITNTIPSYLQFIIKVSSRFVINHFIEIYCSQYPSLERENVLTQTHRWKLPIATSRLIYCNRIESCFLLNLIHKEIEKLRQ